MEPLDQFQSNLVQDAIDKGLMIGLFLLRGEVVLYKLENFV